jgi:hypothetical protein
MSHFLVLVAGNNVEEQLAPYDENKEVPVYKAEPVSEQDKRDFLRLYTTPSSQDKRDYAILTREEADYNKSLSFEELYRKYGEEWNGNQWQKDENGIWHLYTTLNPKAKWDWWQIGGRWTGLLELKDGRKGELGSPGAFTTKAKEGTADIALKKDIDWKQMHQNPLEYNKAARFWELYVEKKEEKYQGEREKIVGFELYKPEFFEKRYQTKQTYARAKSNFSVWAFIQDGQWYEKGEMGLFGMSGETHEEGVNWELNFFDRFIAPLSENEVLTIVDCHI